MKLAVAAEVCSFNLMKEVKQHLLDKGHVVVDIRMGNGVCIFANKFRGIYAGLSESVTTAKMHWVVNRCNILCMGAWIVGSKVACEMVDAWLGTKVGEGFNKVRRKAQSDGIKKLKLIEKENFR